VLRIWGVPVAANDVRALITDLMEGDNADAFAAAVRIRSRLEHDTEGLVALEPEHRDAVLAALGDEPREGLRELQRALVHDWQERTFGV
jgi:hypothetical protein